MILRPPRSTRTDTLFPYTTLFRSYYVAVTVAEIVDAGTELENKLVETDPDKLGLLVTPNQIVLEPGAIRSIRLVSLNKPLTRDRVYRVLVAPQVGALKVKDAGADTRGGGIQIGRSGWGERGGE